MIVLGLETSCDETGVALYDTENGLLAEALHSQVDLHAVYGGVVPEIASRDHIRMLLPLIQQVMSEAGIDKPDAIAYTAGPGLVGALMVGGGMANGLGLAWDCPVIPVHHMEGHLLAPMLEDEPPEFPFLALLVSGGHSMLIAVATLGDYRVLGSTLDDAVGEAFDKTAKLLGLDIDKQGAREIARRSRGTPRVAGRLLRRVRDFAHVAGDGLVTRAIADNALVRLEIDSLGLDAMDRRYLTMIATTYKGGPVGVETLAAGLAEPRDTVEDVIEPYLIQLGLLARTARGRMLNDAGWEHMEMSPPAKPQGGLFEDGK